MICVRIFLLMIAIFMWGGCTVFQSSSDVTQELTAVDAQILATDAVSHLEEPLPPAHQTLVLDTADSDKQILLVQALLGSLREKGYGVRVAEKKTDSVIGQGTALRYSATPLESGILLRLQYQGREASRFYPRTAEGKLLANESPFTVRRGGDEQ